MTDETRHSPAETVSHDDAADRMLKIEELIVNLQWVKDRFGNTCVYIRRGGLSWGAVALNRRGDDEKHGIFDLQAQHDRDMLARAGQVERLMEARNRAEQEVSRLTSILNSPVVEPFVTAAVSEAKHQVYRWGEDHDAKKTAWDWFWTLGYLGGKAAQSALTGDWHKAKHHTVTAAALLANWHAQIVSAEQLSAYQRPEGGR